MAGFSMRAMMPLPSQEESQEGALSPRVCSER